MKHVYSIFMTDTPETASMLDEHYSAVYMAQFEIANHVRKLNEMNPNHYFYFIRHT